MVQYTPAPIERDKRQLPSLEEIQANRKIAEAMMREGSSYDPVGHWTQGAARVAQALVGSMRDKQARDQQTGLQSDANSALMGLYKPQSVTGGMPPVPASAMQPQPQMSPEEAGVAKFAQPNLMQGRVAQALDPSLVQAVKGFEGYTPKAAWDYKQHSVGYGTRAQAPGEQISQPEAEQRLNAELSQAASLVGAFAPDAPEGVKKALTSLTFNAGNKWMDSGLGQAVKAGNWPEAQRIFMQYNKAGGETLPGLVNRRQQEAQWFNQQPGQGQGMALGGPQQASQPQMAGQPQQLPQTADASQGQGLDQATLQRMLQNPLTRETAQKLIMESRKPAEYKFQAAGDTLYRTDERTGQAIPLQTIQKPPQVAPGYRWSADGKAQEAVPGGPADVKARAAQIQTSQRVASIDNKIGRLEDSANDLLNHKGLPSIVGGVYATNAPNWPGGEAANAKADLSTLKSQIAGAVIQEMRDASKTGGAVGQVTEKEWPLLMNMIASLDENQSIDQFKTRLKQVVTYAKTLRNTIKSASGTSAAGDGGGLDHLSDEQLLEQLGR